MERFRMSRLVLVATLLACLSVSLGTISAETKSDANQSAKPNETKSGDSKKRAAAHDYGIPQVAFANAQISQVWADNNIVPSPACTDGEWCRRVYLDVIGRVPSVPELQAFMADKDQNRKLKLVESLLNKDEYIDEYARNWTTIWTNLLIGRNGGLEDRSITSRPGMQKYLRDTFARNKPYNKMVYELVTATGTTAPDSPKFNGATNYLINKLDEGAAQATAMTAKHFLGLQVQCTQCHNHPFNDWKQQKFWEMNAFFKQTKANRTMVPGSRMVEFAELANRDYIDETGRGDEAAVFYELRNAETKTAYPVFIDGRAISPSGYVSENDRRTQLGKMMMESPYLDVTIVNRMWQHFLGYGFTKPIDDLGPHNAPSHPELMEYLGKEFRRNSYNMHELIKWITLTEAYSLSSRVTEKNKIDDPLLGETPKFSHFYLRQMRAEELYHSLLVATQAEKTKGSYEEQEKLKSEWLRQFVIAFGTDELDEATIFNGTIPQVLMMFNGDLVKQATSTDEGSFLYRVAANTDMRNTQKINFLFMSGLGRNPSSGELEIANKLLVARKGEVGPALQDVWWAILNSNEFIMNH